MGVLGLDVDDEEDGEAQRAQTDPFQGAALLEGAVVVNDEERKEKEEGNDEESDHLV